LQLRQRIINPSRIGGMGHSVKRKEDPRLVSGTSSYIDDIALPGAKPPTPI
jgi:CO/xanthine dehydrogenase Mo-binding subunit